MRKFSVCWVSKLLTTDQKHTSCTSSRVNLDFIEVDPAKLSSEICLDEKWIHPFTPEAIHQFKEWRLSEF
jgi:hypothetical protein